MKHFGKNNFQINETPISVLISGLISVKQMFILFSFVNDAAVVIVIIILLNVTNFITYSMARR